MNVDDKELDPEMTPRLPVPHRKLISRTRYVTYANK